MAYNASYSGPKSGCFLYNVEQVSTFFHSADEGEKWSASDLKLSLKLENVQLDGREITYPGSNQDFCCPIFSSQPI